MRGFTGEQTLRLVFLCKIHERMKHHQIAGDADLARGWEEIYKKIERRELIKGTDTWATDAFAWCWQHCRLGHDDYEATMAQFFAKTFEVGDIVVPMPGTSTYLRSGASQYQQAIVVSTDPLVLVSEDADMMWQNVAEMKLQVIGKAEASMLEKCSTRLSA